MHKYLTAIGYGQMASEQQLNEVLRKAEETYTYHELTTLDPEIDYCEYRTLCAKDMGICVCGTMDTKEHFERRFYYPYFLGSGVTTIADVTLERRIDREVFAGICDDPKVGISLIFHLQNAAECMLIKDPYAQTLDKVPVTLSGLCRDGMILLPVLKNAETEKKSREDSIHRGKLLSAARNGDQSAMESLALGDIDLYTEMSRRLEKEDIFTIVDTYFMPYGIECDCYSILGEILNIRKTENWETGEEMYVMQLNVNELKFDVCVPVKRVVGEPAVGRRFKGNIWLQGRIVV